MENEQKKAIKDLADLLHENNLSEIEYKKDDVFIRVVGPKNYHTDLVAQVPHMPAVAMNNPAPVVHEDKPVVKVENNILSPMVGVVYLAKDPSSAPFVNVGDTVSVGQTICLIEAMKTFNPIKSTKAGKISAILVETGSPVEYNQPLFSVE